MLFKFGQNLTLQKEAKKSFIQTCFCVAGPASRKEFHQGRVLLMGTLRELVTCRLDHLCPMTNRETWYKERLGKNES